MADISLKKSDVTTLTIKKATMTDGKLVVDSETKDLMAMINDNFGDTIFDITIKTKVDDDLMVEGDRDYTIYDDVE